MRSARLRRDASRRSLVHIDIHHPSEGIDPWHQVDRTLRQLFEIVELADVDRLKFEVTERECLDSFRLVERGPFRAQRGDGVTLATDLAAELGNPLGLQCGIELDLVDVGGRENERSKHADMQNAQHQPRPMISCGLGSRGNAATAVTWAAASVRSAARNLADRARGFSAISCSSGAIGRRVSTRKLGAARARSGMWREEAGSLLRALRKVLTMRSSSEWNAITTSRPPGASRRSAARKPSARLESSSFTKIRRAWNVRVAGWMSPGRPRTTRARIAASSEVVRIACRRRASTTARTTARAWRSS